MAKLLAAETYVQTTEVGMQVMGGYGYNMEFDMERHFRDARARPSLPAVRKSSAT